jgi:hypothetical protein
MRDPEVGPAMEHVPGQRPSEQFDQVIGSLADGALVFPPPFDLATTVALGGNASRDTAAVAAFGAARDRICTQVRIRLDEVDPDTATHREILDVTVGSILEAVWLAAQIVNEANGRE